MSTSITPFSHDRQYIPRPTSRPRRNSQRLSRLLASLGSALAATAQIGWAADSTWLGAVDSAWENPANWQGGIVPGNNSGTVGSSTDLAFFTGTPPQTTIAVDANRNVGTLQFGSISLPDGQSTAFTIGSAGVNGGNAIYLSNGGAIHVLSTLEAAGTANEGKQVVINAPMVLTGTTFSFISDAGSSSETRPGLALFGTITAAAGAPTTIIFSAVGGNTGSSRNENQSAITDGPNGAIVTVVKEGPGTWEFNQSDTNPNTYSGDTIINGGILRSSTAGTFNGLGGFSPNSHYIVNAGGTLRNSVVGSEVRRITINTGGSLSVSSSASTTLKIRSNSGPALTLNLVNPANSNDISFSLPITLSGTTANEGGVTLIATPGPGGTGRVSIGATGSAFDMGSVVRVFDIGQGAGVDPGTGNPSYDLRIRGPVTSPAGFIKTGPGWLQFENATQNIGGTIEVREGRLQFNTSGALTGAAPMLISGGDLRINGGHTQTVSALTMTRGSISGANDLSTLAAGNFTFNVSAGDAADVDVILADWSNGSAALVKNGAGVATLGLANSYTGGTTVNAGTLSVRKFSNGTLAVNAGGVAQVRSQAVANDPIGASRLNNVSIASTGRLDLNNNSLILNTASLSTVTGLIKTGLENGGNFDWGGPGIGSNKAAQQNTTAGSFLYGLGVILNDLAQVGGSGPIYTTFAGETLAGNEVLVKFTYFGDADLSGSIDATDYSLIDNGYVNSLSGWINGDFDYSGSIDATDYALIDNAYVNQSGPLAEAMIAEHTKLFGGEYVAALRAVQSGVIPEPASLWLLALVGWSAKRPRRCRS